MIIVSHRGPYQFRRAADGELVAHQGAGGIVSALSPLLADKTDATWIAAAMSDDDRAAGRAGTIAHLDVNVRLLDLDRQMFAQRGEVPVLMPGIRLRQRRRARRKLVARENHRPGLSGQSRGIQAQELRQTCI